MALQFFEVERGLLHNSAAILAGAGAPLGSGDTAEVGVGSIYQDTSSGDFYVKKVAGAGAGNWTRLALVNEVSTGISWREPVVVIDTTTTTVPTGTAGNEITVDGVAIGDGDRVLFAAIDGGDGRNVYIYDLASGTFSEDSNDESAGDTVYVEAGTGAGRTYSFDGTIWIRSSQVGLDEVGFIRSFIGKAGDGNETPDYSSTVYIADGDSLLTAIGKLDAQLSTNASAISQEVTDRTDGDAAIQSELDATQSGAGLSADGSYAPNGSTSYISTATSLKNADNLLDAQLKSTQDDLDTLETSFATASANLARARSEASATAVTTTASVDSVLVDSVAACKWIVHVQGNQAGDASNKQVVEVLATHDGTASADATAADYSVYAKLRMGIVTGLSFAVDVSGTGAAQVMRLRVTSTMSCDVRTTREVIEF